MIRRFNSTGRVSIPSSRVAVTLRRREGNGQTASQNAQGAPNTQWFFDLKLDLGGLGFPGDARVRVEAWRGNAFQRWDWGTVAVPAEPEESHRVLRDVPETCQFRVSVIAADESGLLLGLADKLRPKLPVESLLPLVPADLGSEVWRLDYGEGDDIVVLKVNDGLPDFSKAVRSDLVFRALVMPQVLRSILERALLVDREDPEEPEGRWSPWFDLARNILPESGPPAVAPNAQDDQVAHADLWIDKVVAAFSADRVKALEGYLQEWRAR